MKNALIIGASSGIGEALAHVLSDNDYRVALLARRQDKLSAIQASLPNQPLVRQFDITDIPAIDKTLNDVFNELGQVDLVVIAAGVGYINRRLDLNIELDTIATNVTGFTAACNTIMHHFLKNRHGHLVALSSISAIRGHGQTLAYNASKAYMSNYLQGLRHRVKKAKLPIIVTDVKPGFVDTDMAKGDGLFWVSTAQKAAWQIYQAIRAGRSHVYISRRWRLVGWLLKILPDFIYHRIV